MKTLSDEEWFIKGKQRNSKISKRRLLDNGTLEYKCYSCGITRWNNKKIVLQIEHLDGDHLNNEVSNITLLCYNCHSQTKTFAGKNVKNKRLKKHCVNCGSELSKVTRRSVCAECHLISSVEKTKDQRIDWKNASYTKSEFINAWNASRTYSEVKVKLGYKPTNGRIVTTIRNEAHFMGLSFDHMDNYRSGSRNKKEHTDDELALFLSGVKRKLHSSDKKVIRQSGILGFNCQECGLPYECNGKFLQLQIDHIDDDNTNNNVENLRLLCPNCHSQTHNWGSNNLNVEYNGEIIKMYSLSEEQKEEIYYSRLKSDTCVDCHAKVYKGSLRCISCYKKYRRINKSSKNSISKRRYVSNCIDCNTKIRKGSTRCNSCQGKFKYQKARGGIQTPDKDELISSFKTYNCNITRTAKHYRVSGSAVVKWCKKYGIPHKVKDLKRFIAELDK